MPKLTIDGQEIEVKDGITVLQACQGAGIEIPHFCFHERLNIAGNCRMCLVDIEKSPKPVASCAMPASEGMIVHTNTDKVKKMREGVMEFLLINHPLDCPICDQGGECDLQDQAFKYGKGQNRFHENKRSVKDKHMGPLIKTHMNRCIYCTRCIRFATEIAGIEEMGTLYRGEDVEVTSYLEQTVSSELSGNMIDICPVGALTSKPYAYQARSWELRKTESIDVFDAVGSNIRIDTKGFEVMRILPKLHEDINEEWLDDRARFSYDGLKNQRIDRPYIKKNDRLVEVSFEEAIDLIVSKLKKFNSHEIAAIAGTMACVESMYALKKLFEALGSDNTDANQFNYYIDQQARGNYLFNTTIAGLEQADLCLLIGADPRNRAPILNARIGKRQRQGMKVASLGYLNDQAYKFESLGDDINILQEILSAQHSFCSNLSAAKKPVIIIGDGIYSRADAKQTLGLIQQIAKKFGVIREDWQGYNILHNHASIVGSLDIAFTHKDYGTQSIIEGIQDGMIKLLYLLDADDLDFNELNDCFIIYQGHHGDRGASRADIVLPTPSYSEKDGIYVNLEGRVQRTREAVKAPGMTKFDHEIFSQIATKLNIEGIASDLDQLRYDLFSEFPHMQDLDVVNRAIFTDIICHDQLDNSPIENIEHDYYMNNVISRASINMARCKTEKNSKRTDNATDGKAHVA